MFQQWLRNLCIAMMAMTMSCVHAFGSSPAQERLLRLVPANAAIVTGIEDPHHGDTSGRLLIMTHNNSVDLDDWIALAGVDDRQEVDGLIEVAMPSADGDLGGHLLLARGTFNGRRILQVAQDNGGVASNYAGVRIVILKPFAREQKEMTDTRWLAMLDDSTAIFGTPAMVKTALDRYLSSAAADGALMKRLQELKPDVNCWSVLTMPGAVLVRHLPAGVLDETGDALLRRVNNFAIGVHYGSKARVDFAISTDSPEAARALATHIGERSLMLVVADTRRTRSASVSVEQNKVRGSVRVPDKEFESVGLAAVYARLSADSVRGQEIAKAVAAH
ncbi:MAG TPA: hypothetical protein VIY53_04975 [Acidobacteriaceae bacterium]